MCSFLFSNDALICSDTHRQRSCRTLHWLQPHPKKSVWTNVSHPHTADCGGFLHTAKSLLPSLLSRWTHYCGETSKNDFMIKSLNVKVKIFSILGRNICQPEHHKSRVSISFYEADVTVKSSPTTFGLTCPNMDIQYQNLVVCPLFIYVDSGIKIHIWTIHLVTIFVE